MDINSDASSLISATSVEWLVLNVKTTLSALSAIFNSSTIKDLTLIVWKPVTVSRGQSFTLSSN